MRRLFIVLCLLVTYDLYSQQLTLDSCYAIAFRNYPLIRQYTLIEQSKAYSVENANKGKLPQLNIAGQSTYQSEVTKVPISMPNVSIPEISKDQHKLYGEVSQPITDLFTIKDQKVLINENSMIEQKKVEVEIYKLRERINQIYFGILLIDEQVKQTEILKKDIQSGIDKTNVAIANGVALKNSIDNLNVEILKIAQRKIELNANRKAYLGMLSILLGLTITETVILEMPNTIAINPTINRPEIGLYSLQKNTFAVQNKLITNRNLPRLSLFFQSGFGRPALNMLSNDFKGYYIGGVRLNWSLAGLYTLKNDRRMLSLNQRVIDIQHDVFMFNTNLSLQQQSVEVKKMQQLIETDNNIIELREKISRTTKNQLEYGTATVIDYLNNLNAEDQAKQTQLLHKIQFLQALHNYQTTSGN